MILIQNIHTYLSIKSWKHTYIQTHIYTHIPTLKSESIIITSSNLEPEHPQWGYSTSCGGTSNDTVRKSTFLYESMQGTMKNIPGPFAPPFSRRPSRNMTALSYSCTTCEQKNMSLFWFINLKYKACFCLVKRSERIIMRPDILQLHYKE